MDNSQAPAVRHSLKEFISSLFLRIEEVEEEKLGLEEIIEANFVINRTLRLEELIETILEVARSVLRCETASIMLYNENTNELEFKVSLDEGGKNLLKRTLNMGEGIAGTVAQTLKPYIANRVQDDPHFAARFDQITGFKTNSILCVPLKAREKLVGVMELINKEKGENFTALDLKKSMALGNLIAIAIENATLYKKAEELGNVKEMSRFKSELMALVAHELKNPLTGIKAYTELALNEPEIDKATREEYLKIVMGEVTRMSKLIDSFLSVSQVESGEIKLNLESFSMKDIVNQRVKAFEHVSPIHQIISEFEGENFIVRADRERTIQVIDNLLGNAIKYSPRGGEIIIRVRDENTRILVSIKDPGIGIPAKYHGNIFRHFFRVRSSEVKCVRGTGLGLTITKLLVEKQGGNIWFESDEGKGTTFFFTIPCEEFHPSGNS